MKIITPKKFSRNLPYTYQKTMDFGPYILPFFGTLYFGRIKKIIKIFQKNYKKSLRILDVGGGIGFFGLNFKLNFPKSEIIILDLYKKKYLEFIERILNNIYNIKIDFLPNCDIQKKIPLKEKSVDIIFALDVLEHIYNVDNALDEILRVLKEEGLLFISVPTEGKFLKLIRSIWNKINKVETNPHWNGLVKSELEFFTLLKSKNLELLLELKYPINSLPKVFSYDIFYLVKKKKPLI